VKNKDGVFRNEVQGKMFIRKVAERGEKHSKELHNLYSSPNIITMVKSKDKMVLPRFRLLIAGFSPRRPGFMPREIHMQFIVEKVTPGQAFLGVLPCQYHSTAASY
jgi:hypothetical protein